MIHSDFDADVFFFADVVNNRAKRNGGKNGKCNLNSAQFLVL